MRKKFRSIEIYKMQAKFMQLPNQTNNNQIDMYLSKHQVFKISCLTQVISI